MNEWMNEWMNECINEWMNKWIDKWMNNTKTFHCYDLKKKKTIKISKNE